MYINCLWVSGQFKGQGNSNLLLDECIRDSKEKGRIGLVILSSEKKQPFLADPKFLLHKGFTVVDSAQPSYRLMYLPFTEDAPRPEFRECVKNPNVRRNGYVLYYNDQCPYTAKYVPIAQKIAQENGAQLNCVHFETSGQAKNSPAPFTAYSLFYNGSFLTNEILSEKKLCQLFEDKK